MDTSPLASRNQARARPRGRSAAWTTLLLGLALSQVLGGGCTFAYSSGGGHDDDDDDDDNGGGVVIVTATDESGGDVVVATDPLRSSEPAATGGLVVVLQELPDVDGDGLGDLAIIAVDGNDAELPAGSWLLSGADGAVLDMRDLGSLRPRAHGAPRPAAATEPPAAPPSAPTTSAPKAPDQAPAGARAPHRD